MVLCKIASYCFENCLPWRKKNGKKIEMYGDLNRIGVLTNSLVNTF